MAFSPMELLAGGGIAATLAATWNQVKNVFGYARSQVLVKTHLDGATHRRVLQYLAKANLPRTPGGDAYISTQWFHSKSGASLLVPFKTRGYSGIWMFNGWPMLVTQRDLITPRGFPVEKLVIAAFRASFQDDYRSSHFCVRDIFGTHERYDRSNPSHNAIASPTSDTVEGALPATQGSFMYEPQEYAADNDAFEHLYYPEHVQKHIEYARIWFEQRDWYAKHSIPWRRGWLLYGPGGTGKSSLARALAQQFRIPLYRYHLATLTDREFMLNWSEMELPGIVLFEDIDTVFDGRKPVSERNVQLTFDTVLNAISGVNSRDGVFLIVTTNHPDKIDPALGAVRYADMSSSTSSSSRPGRIDTTIQLGYMDDEGKELMAERIVGDWPDVKERLLRKTNVLPVQFQEMCIQEAYSQLLKEQGNG